MRNTFPLLLLGAHLGFGVDGTVVNRTTGKPQAGATIVLMSMGQEGMSALGTAHSDAQGKFSVAVTPQGPVLLQATHAGVTYSQMITPGAATSGIEVPVYDSSSKAGDAKVLEHVVVLQLTGQQISVSETVIFRNPSKVTYHDPAEGPFRFALPAAAKGEVRVMARAPQGMPVERTAAKTDRPDVYKVDFPIKPGETNFDLTYSVPLGTPAVFAGRFLHAEGVARLVAPAGVTLAGSGVERIGEEPRSKAQIYSVKGREFKVEIQGTGSMPAAAGTQEENSGPAITQILPQAYDNVYWTLGLTLSILALGFALLYRRAAPTAPSRSRLSKENRAARVSKRQSEAG